jgi:hypothetical protein
MQKVGTDWVARHWDFVEDFGGSFNGIAVDPEQEVYFRELAVAFLRLTFPPPPGCVIEVIEAEYLSCFPVIAVGWNAEPEPLGVREYIALLNKALTEFIETINWHRLATIKFIPG